MSSHEGVYCLLFDFLVQASLHRVRQSQSVGPVWSGCDVQIQPCYVALTVTWACEGRARSGLTVLLYTVYQGLFQPIPTLTTVPQRSFSLPL